MNSSKTKNVFIAIVIIAIVALGLGWLFYSSQDTTLELKTDSNAYFADENPVLKVYLTNPKDANEGRVVVNYDASNISVMESELATGIELTSTDSGLSLDLSKEYFSEGNPLLAELKLDVGTRDHYEVTFNQEITSLDSSEGSVEIVSYIDGAFTFGKVPPRVYKN